MALDDSTDITETAQLFSDVNAEFEVTEHYEQNSLCGTTTGKNLFTKVERTLIQYNLNLNLLRCAQIMVVKTCGQKRA